MALLYLGAGAALAWLLIWLAHRAALRDAALREFQQFLEALDGMMAAPESTSALEAAMRHYRVYEQRARDCAYLSKGGGIPGARLVKAAHWFRALHRLGVLDAAGQPFTEHPAAAAFWRAVWTLEIRSELA